MIDHNFFPGVSAIAVFTVAIVWTMEMFSNKWKTVFGFIIGFALLVARYNSTRLILELNI